MPDPFSFQRFQQVKDSLVWQRMMVKRPSTGIMRLLTWAGYMVKDGTVSGIPSYYASVNCDDETDTASISLTVNSRFDKVFDPYKPRPGHKIIDTFEIGAQNDINDQLIVESLRQRYGLQELDYRTTRMTPQVGKGEWKANELVSENVLASKTLYNPQDRMVAIVILNKVKYTRDADRYQVCALAVPLAQGLSDHANKLRKKPSFQDVKSATADWNRTIRELRGIGFTEEQTIPEWATNENWDFTLGIPLEDSKRIHKSFDQVADSYSEQFDFDPNTGDDFSQLFEESSISGVIKTSQVNGFTGSLPDPMTLDRYVGTPSVEASQLKGIFSGVDEAISLVNQFDSRLLNDVAFIYNYTGGDAYGIYMSALDAEIKDSKLKSLLRMDGYQVQDMPNGGFYATHPQKTKEQIDAEVKSYRQKIDNTGATTFGIDMNKVVGAAKSDANESSPPISDTQDQYLLGVMHLGATMVHEAVHSAGSQSEGPSEQAESRFMQWVMPIINQRRQQRYKAEGRENEYSPLIIDSAKRRSAGVMNWLEKAAADGVVKTGTRSTTIKSTAQFGSQFPINHSLLNSIKPSPWSLSYWAYGAGAIEAMLDSVRPVPSPATKISFEGQLRSQNQNKWTSFVDAGLSTEELLEPERDPLVGYRTTENLMEDSRERPLMLPVKKAWSYEPGIESPGWMSNLDLSMSERVQKFDDNDEETTWFSSKFIRNQPRYNPEYGNPMSKEDGFYSWIVDPRLSITLWEDNMNERPNLRSSPFQRAASDDGIGLRSFELLLGTALKDITSGKIRGTRLVVPRVYFPMIKKFFENDMDIRLDVFDRDDSQVNVWIVDDNIPSRHIEMSEKYLIGDDDSDEARKVFNYITRIPETRAEAISRMIQSVGQAARQMGGKMMVVGDLPLAIATDTPWSVVRTVDFCSDDPDLCIKLAEIVCEKLGANCLGRNDNGMMIVRWGGVAFRFAGETDIEEELNSRVLTPLMLVMDATTEDLLDPTGEAQPDIEARVVRTARESFDAVSNNPLCLIDSIFVASEFEFSIDSQLAAAAAKAEFSNVDVATVWETIRTVGRGKSVTVAEEYGIGDTLKSMMNSIEKEVDHACAN